MKQITEDYCSFEIAKLLKEKGFNIPTEDFYDNTGTSLKDSKIYGSLPIFGGVNWNADQFICAGFPMLITFSRPSQSLALKWLREVHNYYIQIMLDSWACGGHLGYYVVIQKTDSDFEMMLQDAVDEVFYPTYEQAVEAALKFTLENLI